MSDLIKREDAVEAVYEALRTPLPDYKKDFFHDSMSYAIAIVNNIPSADPERKIGKWEEDSDPGQMINKHYRCSECHVNFGELRSNYCPNCGAKMTRDKNE